MVDPPGHRPEPATRRRVTSAVADLLCRHGLRASSRHRHRSSRPAAVVSRGRVHEATGHDGRVGRALAANLAPWQSALGDAFSRLRDRGALTACVPPAELATTVMGALVGAMGRSRNAGRTRCWSRSP